MSNSEMVERAARALLKTREERLALRLDTTVRAWEEVPRWHGELLEEARAVLAALRTATAEMVFAGNAVIEPDARFFYKRVADEVWEAMIDSALADDQRTGGKVSRA